MGFGWTVQKRDALINPEQTIRNIWEWYILYVMWTGFLFSLYRTGSNVSLTTELWMKSIIPVSNTKQACSLLIVMPEFQRLWGLFWTAVCSQSHQLCPATMWINKMSRHYQPRTEIPGVPRGTQPLIYCYCVFKVADSIIRKYSFINATLGKKMSSVIASTSMCTVS